VAQVLLRQCHALGVENPLAVEDDLGRTCGSAAIFRAGPLLKIPRGKNVEDSPARDFTES